MADEKDYWAEDDFEDTVAAALIACFETKVRKNRGAAPEDRLSEARISAVRAEGPYIASNSRWVLGPEEGTKWKFDVLNDPLPMKGVHAFRPRGCASESQPNAYMCFDYIQQVKNTGAYWHRRSGGTLYEMNVLFAESKGISGDRQFFTVTKEGDVVACVQRIPTNLHSGAFGNQVSLLSDDEAFLQSISAWASLALQMLADRRYCWTITAQESRAKAHLGCMLEEVKSLLYARSLPITATGRKRPILHLVESHKRRMRSGTDVDVTSFLRGQQTVEIDGTVFTVNPPATLRSVVSKPSRERYFEGVDSFR